MSQVATVQQLLPLPPSDMVKSAHDWDYIYEPDAAQVLDDVLTRYVESVVYQSVLENLASEHAARMVAMKAASDTATKLRSEESRVGKECDSTCRIGGSPYN